jgi:DNA-binding transcriptional MerR regulator
VELVKLYYRIGEVAQIVGVQPHVLRYWETEFRTIRPQKSGKGQRVYSRRDVEKLIRVKDLLKNQGFTIAGAKKKLREPGDVTDARVAPVALAAEETPAPVSAAPVALSGLRQVHPDPGEAPARTPPTPIVPDSAIPAPEVAFRATPAPSTDPSARETLALARERAALRAQSRVREALLSIREEIVVMMDDLDRPPPRRPKLPSMG